MSDMSRDIKITIRLTEEERERLEGLKEKGGYNTLSDTIRALLKEEQEIPKEFLSTLSFLVDIGYISSLREGLREALKLYLYEAIDIWKIKERAEALKEIHIEMEKKKFINEQTKNLLRK